MRIKLIFGLLLLGTVVSAQTKINGVGIAFDVNGSTNMKSGGIDNLLKESSIPGFAAGNEFWTSRLLTSYSMTLSNPDKDYLAWEIDLLQGQDFYDSYSSEWSEINDTSYSNSSNIYVTGAVLGLRTMAKLRTPSDKRFFYHFGLGLEGLYSYDVNTDGYRSESISHWPSGYYSSTSERLDPGAIDNITSVNLIQQVGIAFRIGKNEESFPLNKTYIEADFQIMTNFTNINADWTTYRGYGGSFSLIYEFR